MTKFTATVSAGNHQDALEKVIRRLPEGWTATEVECRSQRHRLWDVLVTGEGNRNDLWVVLTSYGISPSEELDSSWQKAGL